MHLWIPPLQLRILMRGKRISGLPVVWPVRWLGPAACPLPPGCDLNTSLAFQQGWHTKWVFLFSDCIIAKVWNTLLKLSTMITVSLYLLYCMPTASYPPGRVSNVRIIHQTLLVISALRDAYRRPSEINVNHWIFTGNKYTRMEGAGNVYSKGLPALHLYVHRLWARQNLVKSLTIHMLQWIR